MNMEASCSYSDFTSGIKFVKSAHDSSTTKRVESHADTEKCDALVDAVFSQPGIRGQLVIYDGGTSDSPVNILQNSLSVLQMSITVDIDRKTNEYNLFIGNEIICSGSFKRFENKQDAKHELAKVALDLLKKDCFVLVRNRYHTDITEDDLMKKFESPLLSDSDFNKPGSTAHNIMLKMGWQGGGLGSKLQGRVENVQLYENVDRQGLGNKNILKEVTKILKDFSKSNKFTILAFDSSFTKSEREAIHKTARRFNLKSKSEGKGDDRRITVSRKMNRSDIVRQLLREGGESSSYILKIPENYKYFELK